MSLASCLVLPQDEDMINTTCREQNAQLNFELLRSAIGPGLQVSVGGAVFRLLSHPVVEPVEPC